MNRYLRWISVRTDMLIVQRGIETGRWGERESMLENPESWSKHWGIAGESKRQVNTGKCKGSQVLFSVVNRRLDDECQRVCGVYRGVDKGPQGRLLTPSSGDCFCCQTTE